MMKLLLNLNGYGFPGHSDYQHGYQSYACMFMPNDIHTHSIKEINARRNAWMDDLQKSGISTRPNSRSSHAEFL